MTWRWTWLGQTTSRFPRSSKNHWSANDARPAPDRSQMVTLVDQNRDALQGSAALSRRSLAFRAQRHRSSCSDSPRPNSAQSTAYIQWQLCGRWIAPATVQRSRVSVVGQVSKSSGGRRSGLLLFPQNRPFRLFEFGSCRLVGVSTNFQQLAKILSTRIAASAELRRMRRSVQ
jgi:hypothetical protein